MDLGLIRVCLCSPDFNGVDGILGFGLPKAGEEGRELPTPILFAMTDQENKDSNAGDLTRKFSFFSTDTDGTALVPVVLLVHFFITQQLQYWWTRPACCRCER